MLTDIYPYRTNKGEKAYLVNDLGAISIYLRL